MIDRTHPLSIARQAQFVGISRGSVYYESEPTSGADLKLMRRTDELHLELPFAGARMSCDLLRSEGFTVGRKHMTMLMRRMGITALCRKPNTSKRAPGHTIWPHLLRTLNGDPSGTEQTAARTRQAQETRLVVLGVVVAVGAVLVLREWRSIGERVVVSAASAPSAVDRSVETTSFALPALAPVL